MLTRFEYPISIVVDNAKLFCSLNISKFCMKHGTALRHSSNYYPQGNGQVESTPKNLVRIMKKMVENNKRCWDTKRKYDLWADRITTNQDTRNTFFEFVYGTRVSFPINIQIHVYQFMRNLDIDQESLKA